MGLYWDNRKMFILELSQTMASMGASLGILKIGAV